MSSLTPDAHQNKTDSLNRTEIALQRFTRMRILATYPSHYQLQNMPTFLTQSC